MPSAHNVHQRKLLREVTEVGALIDSLASSGDRLWPAWRWPAQRLDGPLAVGARGGHGPIRYTVAEYTPGARVVYLFTAPRGLIGRHGFEVVARDWGATVLRHTLAGTTEGTMRLAWPLVWRPMHDALIEDALDTAEAALGRKPIAQRQLPTWVRVLRTIARRLPSLRRATSS